MKLSTFTNRLKEIRLILGITQKELAAKSGVSALNISRMERSGKVRAEILFQIILYYSSIISIDMVLDDKAWITCLEDKDLLFRKVSLNSVVSEKLKLMQDHIRRNVAEEKTKVARDMNSLQNKLLRGLESIISLTEE